MDAVDSFIMHQNQKKDLKRQREISAKAYRAEQAKADERFEALPLKEKAAYLTYRRIASIENDHLEAMRDAMEYLFGLGHRHIAYLNGLGKEMSNDLRYVGYKKMVENLKLPCGYDLLINGKYPYATGVTEGYEEAKKLMQLGKKFTAVICTNYMMAFSAMKALQENGLRIPQDVSVMGFDGIEKQIETD